MNRVHANAALALAAAFAALSLAACSTAGSQAAAAAAPVTSAAPLLDPIASFETVRAVLQSPRCVNCHPSGDAPMQGDDSKVHLQKVVRGVDGRGVPGLGCVDCHAKANAPDSYGPNQPPGVSTGWRLPGADHKLIFAGLSSHDLCEQVKDPSRNGGKNGAELLEHVGRDPLVLWGWAPGVGRKPVAVPHAEFVKAFAAWSGAGGPCPK